MNPAKRRIVTVLTLLSLMALQAHAVLHALEHANSKATDRAQCHACNVVLESRATGPVQAIVPVWSTLPFVEIRSEIQEFTAQSIFNLHSFRGPPSA